MKILALTTILALASAASFAFAGEPPEADADAKATAELDVQTTGVEVEAAADTDIVADVDAQKIVGRTVYNEDDEAIGMIEEVVAEGEKLKAVIALAADADAASDAKREIMVPVSDLTESADAKIVVGLTAEEIAELEAQAKM